MLSSSRGKPVVVLGLVVALVLSLGTGCTGVVYEEPGYGHGQHDGWHSHHYHPVCAVPPGHLPPPGACRIWIPELPPGQQPPPGDCHELSYQVPPGACLVYGD